MKQKGLISLLEQNPSYLTEWDAKKNKPLTPADISFGSARKVWWKCTNGHQWEASPNQRSKGNGCPYCSNQRILSGYNDLATLRPDLLEEWDYDNNTLDPAQISAGTNKKATWVCKTCGQSWTATIASRAKANTGCPHCKGNTISVALKARNLRVLGSLAQTYPELAAQWHPTNNGEETADDVVAGSDKKVWWLGTCGHEWKATINSRVKGIGCPICHNHQLLVGFNDLASQHPELLDEWDYQANHKLPSEVLAGTEEKTAWICRDCGHRWETRTYLRTQLKRGCPKCGAHNAQNTRLSHLIQAFGSLSDTHPQLTSEWHPQKNVIKCTEVTHGSTKKVWWICPHGHEYEAAVYQRVAGRGCPICAGKQVLPGFNDLASQYPEIAAEWHPKNKLMPHAILATSGKKVWWQCHACGHEYYKAVEQRTRYGRHCPKCNTMTSIAETFICYYLDQINISYEQSYRPVWLKRKEIDVYLAKYNVGVEYDGKLYHQNIERDIEKSQLCAQSDVTLVRIREKGCPELPMNNIWFTHAHPEDYKELTNVLTQLFNYLHEVYQLPLPDIDTIRDMQEVLAMRAKQQYNKSIAACRPDLLDEWDYEHNIVKPELVSVGSNVKIHWICKKCGYRWQSIASSRAKQNGAGCPVCAGRAVKQGYNDLCTTHPELAQEWNYIKNDVFPTEITAGSNKKVWWKCPNEHEWKAVIRSRASGVGCPYCSLSF